MSAAPRVEKQIAIMRRLLDHGGMQRIARRETLPVPAVAIDQAGEPRLGGLVARVVGRVRELVDGEGEREKGEGDVESFLWPRIVSLEFGSGRVGGWGGRSVEEGE